MPSLLSGNLDQKLQRLGTEARSRRVKARTEHHGEARSGSGRPRVLRPMSAAGTLSDRQERELHCG